MSEIQTVRVRSSDDVKEWRDRASSVKIYDEHLSAIFPYFIKGDPGLIGEFSDTLSDGYSGQGFGPVWPSFASVNDGRDGKVLWISETGLECLLTKHQNDYIFDVQEGK